MARPRSAQSKRAKTQSPPASTEPAPLADPPPADSPATVCSKLVDELERDLDRILFRIMSEGGMPEIERQIRLCRRLLILGSRE
jgi:hypothetical protein